jgi:NitT/TauT family transport system substrate-binding protein
MRAFVDQNKETVATFVKATMAGWKSFLDNPAPGLSIIQSVNQKADDGWVRYSVDTIRRLGLVTGGEAKTRGIGTMNDERWKTLADFMIDAGLLKSGRPTKDLYTLDFANAADIIP